MKLPQPIDRAEILRTGMPRTCQRCGGDLIVTLGSGIYCPSCKRAHLREVTIFPPKREMRSAN